MSTAIAMLDPQPRSSSSAGEQLGAEITRLCSHIYAAEARLLNLIRMFDERKYWQELGLCSCAHWLNFKCGIGMNAAREKVRVANALADLPKISTAFEKGQLSYSKVRAMTRIADSSNEDYLLMIAHHGTAHHVEKLVAKFRTAQRLQDAEAANEQYRDREVTHYYDHDGCLVIKARLPAEQGALIVKALEMAMDKDFADADDHVRRRRLPPRARRPRKRPTNLTHRRPPRRCPRRNRRDLHEQQRIIGFDRGPLPGRGARYRGNVALRRSGFQPRF